MNKVLSNKEFSSPGDSAAVRNDTTKRKQEDEELQESHYNLDQEVTKQTSQLENADKKKRSIGLKAAYDELKELEAQKDIFISIIIHELQTPLTSIKGFSQLLMDKSIAEIDDKTHHYLNIINKNSEKMYHLIKNLIDSTKINLGQIKMFSTNVDVYSIFNEIKEIMEIIFKDKQIIPVFHIENNLPNINADPGRVIYILKNILMNAVQATESGGSITLKIYKNGKCVQFEVQDTGIGISEENQKYIFNRFYQVKYPLTKQFTGQGLGLSICKGLLDLMNGVIWFESAPGKGSKFYFSLPIEGNDKYPCKIIVTK